jgi:uncharacterized membrane protein YeaQ/YmgE (transglycosylase-associated protein family)
MSILSILFIGMFIGWLVAAVLGFDEGIFMHMLLGALGAVLGSLLSKAIGHTNALSVLTWGTLLWCAFSALFVTAIASIITHPNSNSGA